MEPMLAFLGELLLQPCTRDGAFLPEIVESEKKNLIATIEAERNDKRAYAMAQLFRAMCREDSYGIPRLGDKEQVAAITPQALYDHYRRILAESRMELFYVGTASAEQVAALIRPVLEQTQRNYVNLPGQTAFSGSPEGQMLTEQMEVTQAKLCMGFVTPITNRKEEFAAMQILNTVFGGGMTSKLFMHVRETLALCYSIGSAYYGTKGIMTVSAGIDEDKEQIAREEILGQLEACCRGNITPEELSAAKEAILASLQTIHDSPGAIEGYYSTAALSGLSLSPEEYSEAVQKVTVEAVAAAAKTVTYHSSFVLKGGAK
jgi:predicted Zn-dependent peptidase